jgi:hypothetical protein
MQTAITLFFLASATFAIPVELSQASSANHAASSEVYGGLRNRVVRNPSGDVATVDEAGPNPFRFDEVERGLLRKGD